MVADSSKALAKEIAALRREVSGMARGSQASRRSFQVNGEPVTLPEIAQTATTAVKEAGTANAGVSAVKVDAATARAVAEAATTRAQAAAVAADTAQASALEAAGIARDKGKIVYTTSEPTGDPLTLWIRPPSNVPYRWDGTAWVAISDATINNAQNAADRAIAAAADAKAIADGKARSFFQDTAPTGLNADDVGDLWYQTSQGNRLHRWSGTAWVLTSAGPQAISATARQLGSITTYYLSAAPTSGMVAGDLWVNTANNALSRYDGSAWVSVVDTGIKAAADRAVAAETAANNAREAAQQAQNAANTAQGSADRALTTAQGKNTVTYSTSIPNATANPGIRAGDLWYQTNGSGGTVVGTWRWSGSAWVAAVFGDAVLNSLTVGKLTTGQLSAGQRIIAGPATGTHAEMTDTGFRVFANDPAGGAPTEVIRLGTDTDDYFAIIKSTGELAASIDGGGALSVAGLASRSWPQIGSADWSGQGGRLDTILDRRPRGLVAYGSNTNNFDSNTTAGRGIIDLTCRMFYGRIYRVHVKCRINGTTANDALAEVQVRYTQSEIGRGNNMPAPPPSPTINSAVIARQHASVARPEAQGVYFEKLFSFGPGTGSDFRDMRLLLCLARPVGSTTLTLFGGGEGDATEFWVEDIGPFIQPTFTINSGGGTTSNPGPPPAPQTQRYNRSWVGTWHRVFTNNGAIINKPDIIQGPSPDAGNLRSYIGFTGNDLEGAGSTMDAALANSVIEDVGLYLYSSHWYWNAGGTALVGMHGFRNPPGSFGGGDEVMVGDERFAKPGGKWISLARSGINIQNWANGTWKGVMMGQTGLGNDQDKYGRFASAGTDNAPVINITFRK